jgi:hypothetical protein
MTGAKSGPPTTMEVTNSPVEFLVIGPRMGKDAVLVKSKGAGLDLLGIVAGGNGEDGEYRPIALMSLLMPWTELPRQLNVVESDPASDLAPTSDKRRSKVRFAWVGQSDQSAKHRIERLFRSSREEIQMAVLKQDQDKLDWLLAPLILACVQASQRRLRSRATLRTFLLIYGIVFAALFIGLGIRSIWR